MNDWVKILQRYWTRQIDRIKRQSEQKARSLRLIESHEPTKIAKEKP